MIYQYNRQRKCVEESPPLNLDLELFFCSLAKTYSNVLYIISASLWDVWKDSLPQFCILLQFRKILVHNMSI